MATKLQQEKAEKIVVELLQEDCRRIVYGLNGLGWDWDKRSRQLTYIFESFETRKSQAELFYERVSSFDLSPKFYAVAWWPLLQVELIIEVCHRIVEFINNLQVIDQKIDIPKSLIAQIMAWYPRITECAKDDKLHSMGVEHYQLHNMTNSALTRAFLSEVVEDKDASLASVSKFISKWLESGLITLVDGDLSISGFQPPKRDLEHSLSLPMSYTVYNTLKNVVFPWDRDDAITDTKRMQTVKAVIEYFRMNRQGLNNLVREAFTSYCKREHASVEGIACFIRRVKLLGLALPSVYKKILSLAPHEFGDIVASQDYDQFRLSKCLSNLRFLCDAYDFIAVQRDRIVLAMLRNERAQLYGSLGHKALMIEVLYIQRDRIERIEILAEQYDDKENSYFLSELLKLAESNGLFPLKKELNRNLEVIETRQAKHREEVDKKREEEKVKTQADWKNNLQKAVLLLEKKPTTGQFLVEAHQVKPIKVINYNTCVIATSTTASLHLGDEAETILSMLRAFRDSVIKRLPKGDTLIAHYDKTAPPVARWVAKNRLIRASFWYGFIRPSMYLLKQRKTYLRRFVVNFAVTSIFLAGLAWTTVLHFFAPQDSL